MSKHLFIINDVGTYWEITGTRLEMDDFVVDPLLYFETGSEDFYLFVKGLVDGANEVKYLKGVSPAAEADLTITPLDALTVYKARFRTKGKHILKQYCDFTLQFDFFEFSILNNKLIDAGYVITDENREEKYLEIINAGDQTIIDILEVYLEVRDSIAIHKHHYDNYQTFKTAVNDSADTAAVDTAFATYTALFD